MAKKNSNGGNKSDVVTVKKYANRRLYNTETSTYVTLDDLAEMVRADRDFTVHDAKTGDDLTHSVLTQIIVDQESRGQTMLPVPFLRQLIRFYDDSISRMVPGYLQFSLEALAREQENFQAKFSKAFSNPSTAMDVYKDQVRRNMEIFEQAMTIWSPFSTSSTTYATGETQPVAEGSAANSPEATTPQTASKSELEELKSQLESMQRKVDDLTKNDDDKT